MSDRRCEECGRPMPERPSRGLKPRFCSRACQLRKLNRKPERTYAGRLAALLAERNES